MDAAEDEVEVGGGSGMRFQEPGDPLSTAAQEPVNHRPLDGHRMAARRAQRRGLPSDTTREAARVQRAALAARSPEERVGMVFEMSAMMRQMVVEGIRRRHPDIAPRELQLRVIERFHGKSVAAEVAASLESQLGG